MKNNRKSSSENRQQYHDVESSQETEEEQVMSHQPVRPVSNEYTTGKPELTNLVNIDKKPNESQSNVKSSGTDQINFKENDKIYEQSDIEEKTRTNLSNKSKGSKDKRIDVAPDKNQGDNDQGKKASPKDEKQYDNNPAITKSAFYKVQDSKKSSLEIPEISQVKKQKTNKNIAKIYSIDTVKKDFKDEKEKSTNGQNIADLSFAPQSNKSSAIHTIVKNSSRTQVRPMVTIENNKKYDTTIVYDDVPGTEENQVLTTELDGSGINLLQGIEGPNDYTSSLIQANVGLRNSNTVKYAANTGKQSSAIKSSNDLSEEESQCSHENRNELQEHSVDHNHSRVIRRRKVVKASLYSKQQTSARIKSFQGKNRKLMGLDKDTGGETAGGAYKAPRSSMTLINMDDEDDEKLNVSQSNAEKEDMYSSKIIAKKQTAHADLRKVFTQKYGVTMDFPAFYLESAKIVPNSKDHIVSTAFHIIPKSYTTTVQTTYVDNTYDERGFEDLYPNVGRSILIRLSKAEGRFGFKTLREVQLEGIRKCLIKFSSSGKFFGILLQSEYILNIFSSRDVLKLFDSIQNEKAKLHLKIKDPEKFGYPKRVVFDMKDRYVAIISNTMVLIYNLQKNSSHYQYGQLVKEFKIDIDRYTRIHDIQLDSDKQNKGQFRCQIACKRSGITNIHIFDISNPDDYRQISYMRNKQDIMVQISEDFKRVLLSNGVEHYMHNGTSQENFPWIKDKYLRHVLSQGDGFYLVTSKDYDRDIDILYSTDQKFNASIDRKIEPGLLKVYDSQYFPPEEGDPNNTKGQIRILSMLGDNIYMDTIDIAKSYCHSEDDDPQDGHISQCLDKYYMAYSFNWPYFSYASRFNYIFILNSFNPYFVQRYELPKHVAIVSASFLTDTHDYYCIVETKNKEVEIYHIDLDHTDPVLNGPLFKYPFSKVKHKLIKGFHVRGSSQKEKINLNKALMVYILHDTSMYGWVQGSDELKLIAGRASNMYYLSDDEVFFMQTLPIKLNGKMIEHSKVYIIQSLFGSYKVSDVYQDKDIRAEILNFGVDNTKKVLIILTGIKNTKEKRDKFVTLYDIDKEKVLATVLVKNREIIGRLKSNLYNFVGGHIYYGNNVIKVRYDILKNFKGGLLKEEQLFDEYKDILGLHGSAYIQSGTPIQTCLYNRLSYIIRNEKELKPREILILPYLHERKIYLNRRLSTNQFYTLYKHNGHNYILCLCLDDNKMYVYSETGRLIDRVLYMEIAKKCGKPETISEDGQNLVFRKSERSKELYLVKIYIDRLELVREIDIVQRIESYIIEYKKINVAHHVDMLNFWGEYLLNGKDLSRIRFSYCLNDAADLLVRIRPKKELTEQIIKQRKNNLNKMFNENSDSSNEGLEDIANCSFFYYSAGFKNKIQGEYLYFDSQIDKIRDLSGVSMNEKYIFLWNLGMAWSINLRTKEFEKLSLYISEKEKQTFIKYISAGSDPNTICIRVEQSPILDCVIYWDLNRDLEIESFDVDQKALLFQDCKGHTYIAEKDYVYLCHQGCKIKCYNMKVSDFNMENVRKEFGFQYGHRVEEYGYNFLIMRNYINLSFSYMTFVIKELFDHQGYVMENYLFDLEGYDFVLDKETLFTKDETLVTQDYEKLQFILRNYDKIDPVLMESLHFMNSDKDLPLHISVRSNNHRMVNLLLKHMAKINYSAVKQIRNIFSDLINYEQFCHYLQECPFQTVQMENKQTLKIKFKEDDRIVQAQPHGLSYVDENYFTQKMGEEKKNNSYLTFAVEVQAMRADWILNEKRGQEFLRELLKQQRIELFMTRYIMIIIQFLYNKFSFEIKRKLLPVYIVHIVSVLLMITFNEEYREQKKGVDNATTVLEKISGSLTGKKQPTAMVEEAKKYNTIEDYKYKSAYNLKIFFQVITSIMNLLTLFVVLRQTIHLKWKSIRRIWSLLDFVIVTLNMIVAVDLFVDTSVIFVRCIETFLVITMFFKSLYFLRLVSQIAPLVNIIFIILYDIQYFLLVFILGLFAFVFAFYIVGKNQVELLKKGEQAPGYSEFWGAFDHVYSSSLGEFDTESYWGHEMTPLTVSLFIAMSFFMCILLLNMLIAMMSESFTQNHEVAEANKKMSQLEFVVDNWFMNPLNNQEDIVYLVAAFTIQEQQEVEDKIDDLKEALGQLNDNQFNLMQEVRNIQKVLASITSATDQENLQKAYENTNHHMKNKESVAKNSDFDAQEL